VLQTLRAPRRIRGVPPKTRGLLGLAMLLAGVALVGFIFYISDDRSPASETIFFRLGLTFISLITLAGQVLGVIGAVYVWRAVRARGWRLPGR
jgi:hypothetical protein